MRSRMLAMTTCAALLLGAAGLVAAEKKLQLKDLPAAVQKAVQEETKGATIKSIVKEVENGKTQYEVETLVNGHTRDVNFSPTGDVLVVEEAVTLDSVPAPVKAAFEARGKVLVVETVKKGKTLTYEAQIEKNGKKSGVEVDANGKPVKP